MSPSVSVLIEPSPTMVAWLEDAKCVVFELATLLKHAEEIKAEAKPITIMSADPAAAIESMRRTVRAFDEAQRARLKNRKAVDK